MVRISLVAHAVAFGWLTESVFSGRHVTANRDYLDRLSETAPWGWLAVAVVGVGLAARLRRDPLTTERLLMAGVGLVVLSAGLLAPFLTPQSTHFTHPLWAAAAVWVLWPWLASVRLPTVPAAWGLAGFAVAATVIFLQSYRRHYWFGSGGKDLGLFHQTVWLLSQFEAPQNTVMGMHAFGDHLEFVDLLAVPFVWLWNDAGALLLAQALLFASGSLPLFWLAQRRLGDGLVPWLVMACYWLGFDAQSAVMFDFNPTTCGVGFIPWVVWAFDTGRYRAFGVALVLLALSKENLVLYGLGLCLALSLQAVGRRRALVAAGLLVVLFVVEMKLIFPLFRDGGFRHLRFDGLGATAGEMAISVITEPHRALALLVTPSRKLEALLMPLSTVAFIGLLAPRFLLALGPVVLERFWSSHANRWWGHHYGAGGGVTMAVAAVFGLVWIKQRHGDQAMRAAGWVMLVACLLVGTVGRFGPGDLLVWRHHYYTTPQDRQDANRALAIIPNDASVAAQNHLLPHLSGRRQIYEIRRPIRAEYVAFDFVQTAWPWKGDYAPKLARELLAKGYGAVACEGQAAVLRRGAASTCELPAVP